MRRQHFRQLALITGLSLCLASSAHGKSANKDEVEQALASIGSGSAEELKRRLFTDNITFFSAEFSSQAIKTLPAALRDQRITQGRLVRRVEKVFQQVLQLCERRGTVELFIFQEEIPLMQLWRGCVLVISAGLAEELFDGELAGLIAHELGHSYFEDEMVTAQRNQDTRAMRQVELKCDAVAILSLKLMGQNPGLFLRGLHRIAVLNQRQSRSSGMLQSHPRMVERALLAKRLIKALA